MKVISLSLLFISLVGYTLATSARDEDKLLTQLMKNKVSKHFRPVKDTKNTLKVSFGLSLLNFEALDETSGTLHLNLWFRYLWHDDYLVWNPDDANGTDHMRLPTDIMWTPDLMAYNKRGETEIDSALAVVSSDGSVLYIPPARTATHCDLDFSYFPYDTQHCKLKFGSWTYDGFKVDIDFYDGFESMDTSDYQHNAEWDIVGSSGTKNEKYYPCCEEPYPDLTFNLTLSRKTHYYTYVYLGPAVVLALLLPFIFLLPPADPQKITLGVGLLICFTLFFMEMATAIPTIHSHTPLITKYYMVMYILICVAMALSTIISNLARRTVTVRHPPEVLKKVLLSCLGRCLCVSYNMYDVMPAADKELPEVEVSEPRHMSMQRQQSSSPEIKEWLLMATVVDRLLFLIYVILTILLTIIILSVRG